MYSMEDVKEVRNRSHVGLSECKKALDEANGDVEQALVIIQKKGLQRAIARESRVASEGGVTTYEHNGRIGVMVEINCETDFVARGSDFREFCELVKLQVASMNPQFVKREDVPEKLVEIQNEIFQSQLSAEKKPEAAWAKIMPGKFTKWYSEICLMDQDSVMVPGKTIEQLRTELVSRTGENITVRRFVRWELGQGIQKADKKDYADEVAELVGVNKEES